MLRLLRVAPGPAEAASLELVRNAESPPLQTCPVRICILTSSQVFLCTLKFEMHSKRKICQNLDKDGGSNT